ncbi:hypothetical protein MJO28_006309 [Puccinia striiformis f. sp. tritici]|uniref:Uncharacterized protein n=1 Tax=Puccinia striiformis f. sp. tritici TaxID=168172 RepID=A0ACC0EGK0_9BASI|nr:hypothetical protein MJO28_006309 [Puccinia striiformis f. sp. tritici]KAI7958060.1 hypothetical protein MJO29_006277 [Puccinia striiformis f. sp. tritici]
MDKLFNRWEPTYRRRNTSQGARIRDFKETRSDDGENETSQKPKLKESFWFCLYANSEGKGTEST